MKENKWIRLLAYVTRLVNQDLILQNEYLAVENRVLRAHLPARLRLSHPERSTLAEIGKRFGRKALAQVACVAKPEYKLSFRVRPILGLDFEPIGRWRVIFSWRLYRYNCPSERRLD